MQLNIPPLEQNDADPQAPTTQEQVYRRLRHAIMVGAIPPGTPLTMRGLAEALNVSPTPIREAMRRLTSESAVLEKSNRRFQIPIMERGRFDDLIETRILLETHAAQRSLPFVSQVAIDHLAQIDTQMDQVVASQDYDRLTLLNHAFHRYLYLINPNHSVMPLIESTWLQLGPFQRQVLTGINTYYVIDRHKEILAALAASDSAALCTAITQDIQDGIGRPGQAALYT